MHPLALSAYQNVNISGLVNDRLLNLEAIAPPVLQDLMAIAGRNAARANNRPLHQKIFDAACDVVQRAPANFKCSFATDVAATRRVPIFGLIGSVPLIPHLAGLKVWAPKFPFGEFLVGRGQTLEDVQVDGDWLLRLRARCDKFTHFGLAGALLEAAPLCAAAYLSQRDYTGLATCCIVGAVLGRTLLQVPRLIVCAAAVFDGVIIGALVAAGSLSLEVGLRISIGSVRLVATAANLRCNLDVNQYLPYLSSVYLAEEMFDAGLAADDRAIDDGSSGVNGRIAKRTNFLMRRFRPVLMQERQDLDGFRRILAEVEADLRRYCSALNDDNEGLRFAFSRLKVFVDLTWDPGEVSFDPPELHSRR